MDCKRIQKHLVEKALGKELPAKVGAHLEKCRDCSAELERVKAALMLMDREIKAELDIDVSAELAARVREKVSEMVTSRRPTLQRAAAAAAVLIVVTVTVVVVRLTGPPAATEPESAQIRQAPEPTPSHTSLEPISPPVARTSPPELPPPEVVRTPEPDVLVIPGQKATIIHFHRRLSQGRIAALSLQRTRTEPLENLTEPSGLRISAVELRPLRFSRIELTSLTESIEPLKLRQRR
jgi:hypothetical protein